MLREASDNYFNEYLTGECDCEDCCTDRFIEYQPDLFEKFNIPFIPFDFEGNEFENGCCKRCIIYNGC